MRYTFKERLTFSLIILAAIVGCGRIYAQPSWTKKATKAVFTLKTFTADGTPIGESCGFFVGTEGEAVTGFTPLRGAAKAIVVDAQGKESVVSSILGANELYDVAKVRIATKRSTPLQIATATPIVNEQLWLLPYGTKRQPIGGTLSKTEKVMDKYDYYTLNIKATATDGSCPILNADGDVVGLFQTSANGSDASGYAVSAKLANDLKISGLSINDAALNATSIKKDLPDELDQATLTMYLASSKLDASTYASLVDDFIEKFPNTPDGYIYRAQIATTAGRFADADKDMAQALKVADKKDETHFSYSKLIYSKEIEQADKPYAPWTLDKAIDEADEAYKAKPLPVYRQLKAQILYTQKRYPEAYDIYMELTNTNLRSAEMFQYAAQCKEKLRDTTAMIALLDSAVSTFNKPYLKEAAPYILARAQAYIVTGKYRQAVLDLNDYEKLMSTSVNDYFYYVREQAEMNGHLFKQAIDDINKAISIKPTAAYYAEKARVEVRVNLIDDAITSAKECIKADSNLSDGHLILGLALCLKGNTSDGLKSLEQAKSLGHEQAQMLIDKYSK